MLKLIGKFGKVNYLYNNEIFEKLENYEKAIENYKKSLTFIPNFKNNLLKIYSQDYFYSCKKILDLFQYFILSLERNRVALYNIFLGEDKYKKHFNY